MLDMFKFRAWDIEEKEMNYFQNVRGMQYNNDEIRISNGWDGYDNPKYWGGDYEDYVDRTDKYILMQSTGVHTMGNKLLYTGDLIRSPYDMELIKLVYWNQKETRFMCYMNDFMQCGLYQDDITKYKFEIIGNIFENWISFRERKEDINKIIKKYIWEQWDENNKTTLL